MSGEDGVPRGFVRFHVAHADVVARTNIADVVRDVLRETTLHAYGARHPRARRFAGRGIVYAVALPNGEPVVIRHSRRGGALAKLLGDAFLPPTRSAHELAMSERLRAAGVPTPAILAYAVYRVGAILRRADVVTREIPDAFDLAVALMSDDAALRGAALQATAVVVRSLSAAGARHADLNVKNVLLQPRSDGALAGYVLDVDRVAFLENRSRALEQNVARLLRSAEKWRVKYGARLAEAELANLAAACRSAAT